MKSLVLAVLFCALGPLAASADEIFPDVQYFSGHAGVDKKMKGTLTLTERDLTFTAKDVPTTFSVPLTDVREVSNSVEQNPGSTGAKLMLGVFASKKEEFLYVNTENKEGAEALVFKTKNKTSPAMVAKIKFAAKKASGDAATPVAEVAPAAAAVDSVRAGAAATDSLSSPK